MMRFKILIALFLNLLLVGHLRAQSLMNGSVCDRNSKAAIPNVLVRSKLYKQLAITRKSGNFTILTSKNDLLIFSAQGYFPDTLFLVDATAKKVELIPVINSLNEVIVTATASKKPFDPQKEYPEVYEKSKFALSPSRLWGHDARNARHLKRYFENEIHEQKIDSIFNSSLVGNLVPLTGRDLRNFMFLYRPRLSFLLKSSPDELQAYILNTYQKFRLLTPEEQAKRLY